MEAFQTRKIAAARLKLKVLLLIKTQLYLLKIQLKLPALQTYAGIIALRVKLIAAVLSQF